MKNNEVLFIKNQLFLQRKYFMYKINKKRSEIIKFTKVSKNKTKLHCWLKYTSNYLGFLSCIFYIQEKFNYKGKNWK